MTHQLLADLAVTLARAAVDATLPDQQPEDAVRNAISDRRTYVGAWRVEPAGARDRVPVSLVSTTDFRSAAS